MNCKKKANPTSKCEEQKSTSGTAESETHKALLNEVVLKNIFMCMSYKDLKSCQEVGNHEWLKASKKVWWSRTKVVFKRCDWPQIEEKITDFLKQTEITSNAKNYKFKYFRGGLERFWESLGPSIKCLEFGFYGNSCVDDFRKLVYIQCPNLEKLVFEKFSSDTITANSFVQLYGVKWKQPEFGGNRNLRFLKTNSPILPVTWMELLSHFPNLEALEAVVDNENIFKAIKAIREHDQKMLKLKHIKINLAAGGDFLEWFVRSVFLDSDLSLETIQINAGQHRPETVVDILKLHAKSLKDLTIQGDQVRQIFIEAPCENLEKLEELRISNCFFPVYFFKFTPSVRTITISHSTITKSPTISYSNIKVNACKELTISGSAYRRDMDLEFLVNLFPNVEKLIISSLDNHQFSLICKRWKKLVFVRTTDREVNVVGLLGCDHVSKNNDEVRNPNNANLKDAVSMASKIDQESISRKNIEIFRSGPSGVTANNPIPGQTGPKTPTPSSPKQP